MSPANGTSGDPTERDPEAAARPTPHRRLFSQCFVALSVLAFGIAHSFHAQPSVRAVVPNSLPQQNRTPEKLRPLELSASSNTVSLCPGRPSVVRLTVKNTFPKSERPTYEWNANGGNIKGHGPSAEWNLSGLKAGTYTATLNVRLFIPGDHDREQAKSDRAPTLVASGSFSVTVEECQEPRRACPQVTLHTPQAVNAGDTVTLKVTWDGGTPEVKPTIKWRTNGRGKIVSGQGTPEIELETVEADARSKIVVYVSLLGYGAPCEDDRSLLVRPSPNTPTPTPSPTLSPSPTPSPTQTPEPTPSPTQTPDPSPSPTVTPSASPSPSPSPVVLTGTTPEPTPPTSTPSDTPGSQDTRSEGSWLIPLGIVAILGAGVLLAAKLFSSQLAGLFPGTFGDATVGDPTIPTPGSGSTSTADAFKREGAAAVVFGGLKKEADVVHCTVFAPPQVAPGDKFIVQVFAHLARQAKRLAEQAAKVDATARDHGSQPLKETVERGTLLTFTLEMPGLKVDEAHSRGESLVWRGTPESVQFAVDVPENYAPPKTIRCIARIYSGEARAPVGHVMFMLDIAAAATPSTTVADAPSPPRQAVKRYTHAFISYCSKDRPKILPIYLGKRTEWRKAGITDFFDRKDIGSGDVWNEEIQKNLDKCDLFVLFWSSSAKCSAEVAKEIAYALARKGDDEWNPPTFDPLSIELPVPQPLPSGLESLNFDDPLLYFLKAEEALRKEADAPRPRPDGEN